MNSLVYDWLNNSNASSSNSSLIDYVLILSIKGIFISINNLIEYCNNDKNEQFQILTDNIKLLQKNATTTTIINHHNYKQDKITKFDCSMLIIIENNNKLNNLSNQLVCSGDIISSFFKVWRNVVIKNEIFNQIRLFNIHQEKFTFKSFSELGKYKYKSYLQSICFDDSSSLDETDDLEIGLLPDGLKHLELPDYLNHKMVKGMIPNSVTSIHFGISFNQSLDGNWIPENIKELLFAIKFQQPINKGHLPDSLVYLSLHDRYKGAISNDAIPVNVVNLNYKFDSKKNEIKLSKNTIPESTTSLEFDYFFNQPIKNGFIPRNVNTLKFEKGAYFDSEIVPKSLPNSITILHLEKVIKSFDILPPSLKELSFFGFEHAIMGNSLPKSLTSLTLNSFIDGIGSNVLPSNLTYINLKGFDQELVPNMFPKSVVTLKIDDFDHAVPDSYFNGLVNLKSLHLFNFNQVLHPPSTIFPPSLTELEFGKFDKPLNNEIFSNTTALSKLKFEHFNQDLQINQLPSSITFLSFGKSFNKQIISSTLPSNLTRLYIKNPNYNQELPINDADLPISLTSIYISPKNKIKDKKYIKPIVNCPWEAIENPNKIDQQEHYEWL